MTSLRWRHCNEVINGPCFETPAKKQFLLCFFLPIFPIFLSGFSNWFLQPIKLRLWHLNQSESELKTSIQKPFSKFPSHLSYDLDSKVSNLFMLSNFCVGGVSLRRRSSRDNIFIKQFVFHSLKFSILKFSRRNPDFLFLNFSQNSYFHFLQMSRNQIIIPLFMNHSNVTIFNHILSNQKSVFADQWEWPLLAYFRVWARPIYGKLIQSILGFWGMSQAYFWKTHPDSLPNMDESYRNRSAS